MLFFPFPLRSFLIGVLLNLCFITALQAQVPTWKWAKQTHGSKHEEEKFLKLDTAGNFFCLGIYEGSGAYMDWFGFPTANPGHFLTKNDQATGSILWASTIPTAASVISNIAVDEKGDLYIIGHYSGFLPYTMNGLTYNGFGTKCFILKLNGNNGSAIWIKQIGSDTANCFTYITDMVKFDNGHMVCTGISINDTVAGTPFGFTDNYWMAMMDTAGNFSPVRKLTGVPISDVVVDAQKNVIITGGFINGATVDPAVMQMPVLPGSGAIEAYVAKFDPSLNFQWSAISRTVKLTGVYDGTATATGVGVDPQGNIYQVGNFEADTISFATGAKHAFGPVSNYPVNSFLLKYSPSGALIWDSVFVTQYPNKTAISKITVDKNGQVYCAGIYDNVISFGGITNSGNGAGSIFVTKFDGNGQAQWFQSTTLSDCILNCMRQDDNGNLYFLGAFRHVNAMFGTNTLNLTPPSGNPDAGDAFLARLGNCVPATPPSISPNTALNVCQNDSLLLTASGASTYVWSTGDTTATLYVNQAGSYYVNATDIMGCYTSSQPVQVSMSALNTTISLSGTTLTAQAAGATYQWINCQGAQPVANATAQSFTPTQNGSYAVIVTQNGCSDTSACQQVTVSTVSIQDLQDLASRISVYPNPANGQFTVKIMGDFQKASVELIDLLGRQQLQSDLQAGDNGMDVTALPAGVYQLVLHLDGQIGTQALILQK